jgi:preprotein translocase SecF subunit
VQEEQAKLSGEGKVVAYFYLRKSVEPAELVQKAAKALNDKEFYGAKVESVEITDTGLKDFVRLRVEVEERGGEKLDLVQTPVNKVVKDIKDILQDTEGLVLSEPFPRIDAIGASVAYNLKSKAVVALTLALIAIIIYIAVRFELKFGFAAVFALGHDVAIALGAVSLVDMLGLVEMKIDLPIVAAFLTIIGYSLNDTIVVFDRIRENLRRREFDAKRSKETYAEIINDSINETLSRTLLTSFTTFIVVLILFLSGVEAIAGFTFAMLVGVVVGTYSSMFIASPVLIFMRSAEQKKT